MSSDLRNKKNLDRWQGNLGKIDDYVWWLKDKPAKKMLIGENDNGQNRMYLRYYIGKGLGRSRQISKCFMKGWA